VKYKWVNHREVPENYARMNSIFLLQALVSIVQDLWHVYGTISVITRETPPFLCLYILITSKGHATVEPANYSKPFFGGVQNFVRDGVRSNVVQEGANEVRVCERKKEETDGEVRDSRINL